MQASANAVPIGQYSRRWESDRTVKLSAEGRVSILFGPSRQKYTELIAIEAASIVAISALLKGMILVVRQNTLEILRSVLIMAKPAYTTLFWSTINYALPTGIGVAMVSLALTTI
jgi:hypothetical protein